MVILVAMAPAVPVAPSLRLGLAGERRLAFEVAAVHWRRTAVLELRLALDVLVCQPTSA
jgi:hypothetical protein